jgi:hypothetical protein
VHYIVIVGNPVEGLSFFGPFIYSHQASDWAKQNVKETTWVVAAMDEPDKVKYVITDGFNIRKVNLKNMWTVIHSTYIDELPHEVHGGDHHWLSYDLAVAARRVYQVCPTYHGKLPSEVQEAFRNYFPDETWPVIEAAF